jgi:O-antigen ligase
MLLVLACCVTLIMVWCGTALVGLAIALILLFLIYKRIMSRVLNFTFYFAVYITSFIGIVIFRIQNLFSFVIIDMLHKSLTLSGRTDIWEQAFAIIKQSFWTGYGVKQYGLYVNYNGTIWEGHDQILQVMLEGGLISTIFFVLVIILCGARLMKYRKHESSRVLSAFIFVFLIMMLTEQYSDALLFFALLSMGYRIPDIIKQYNDYHLREEDKTPKYSNAVLVHKPTNRGYNPCDPNML